jgi:putative transposase
LKWGGTTRFLYNLGKEEREIRYQQNKNRAETNREYISCYNQINQLTELKEMEGYEFLKEVPSQVLQQSLMDLDRAYQRFFKEKKGYPKWKSRAKNGIQLRFPDGKNIKVEYFNKNNAKILLPKIGWIRFKTGGRKIPANSRIRSVSITGNGIGTDFDISIALSIPIEDFKKSIPDNQGCAVGIDRGVVIARQLSNGTSFVFPHEKVKKLEAKIKKEQQKLSKKKKESSNYKKQQEKIRKIHKQIANIRLDFNHKATTYIAKNHSLVVIEDLKLKNMTKSSKGTKDNPGKNVKAKSGLNRSLLRIGISSQETMLKYKCPKFGSYLMKVFAKNSSRECRICEFTSVKNRKSQSEFLCVKCGHSENADINASHIILTRGLRELACGDVESECVRADKTLNSKSVSKSSKEKEARTSRKKKSSKILNLGIPCL